MKIATFDSGLRFGNPHLRWGNPSYLLEPGDPGYVAPPPSSHHKKNPQTYAHPTLPPQ
jgi:hypothetical protein